MDTNHSVAVAMSTAMSALPKGISQKYWSTWRMTARSVAQSLEPGETWIGGWDSVGLYEGNNKVPEYQSITVHLTTHRLILLPDPSSSTPSSSSTSLQAPALQVHLRYVRQTELYNGFMRSSPKITLSLGQPNTSSSSALDSTTDNSESWTCGVCGYVNDAPPSNGISRNTKCGLCGVGQETSRSMSVPASRTPTPKPSIGPIDQSMGTGSNDTESTAVSGGKSSEVPCPACTFLNHPSLTSCEICSTPLPRRSTSIARSSTPASTTLAPPINQSAGNDSHDTARLSFRKGGTQEAYRRLKNVLSDKAWERSAVPSRMASSTNGTDTPRAGVGIDGILQSMSLDAKNQEDHRKDAFRDLEVLMVRAGEMVKLAQSLNSKLSASGGASDEEATLIRSSLVQLGLPSPALTQDMVRDQQKYVEGLAQELGQILTGHSHPSSSKNKEGLMVGSQGRGVIGLDEVWGLWMRARGVALLPPSTLMTVIPLLPANTQPPINLLILPSSLNVLHTPLYAPPALLSRIVARLSPSASNEINTTSQPSDVENSFSVIEIASHENLPIGLTKELMESIERVELPPGVREPVGLVRDDQAVGDGGVRWYRDIISGWELY